MSRVAGEKEERLVVTEFFERGYAGDGERGGQVKELWSWGGQKGKEGGGKMSRWWWVAGLLGLSLWGCVTVKVNLWEEAEPLREQVVAGRGGDKILLVDLSGLIIESPRRRLLWWPGVVSAARVKEELDKAAKDRRVKGVVLRINSPGGTVSGADLIYHELQTFKKERGVPVVACFLGLAASGGYYVAQAAEAIVASPTNLTGSIGVVAMKPNLKGLLDRLGVGSDVVKTGEWKDFWSPFRPATEKEKERMQEIIEEFYRRFLEVVAQGRGLSRKEVEKLADGRIFTAPEAKELGLVDKVGYLEEAIELAKEKAGLREARVVMYYRPGSYRPSIYSWAQELLGEMSGPQFLYLWCPE